MSCADWPRITAEALRLVREPLRWRLDLGRRVDRDTALPALRRAALGPCDGDWPPPAWLLPHQVTAARRLSARLRSFGGAVLADAVGLGKTYVALAVATRYASVSVLVPAALASQWRRVMEGLAVRASLASHEAVSRGAPIPAADLILVDEAHRFRNPETRRYDRLARAAAGRHVLLLTATPVVNRASDLVNLVRLFLPDHALALQGVPSLAAALAARATSALAHACSAVIVARSPAAVRRLLPPLPEVDDAAVVSPPPVARHSLERLSQGIAALQFPSFADRQAAELLRLHLWYRLASSGPALRESLRRHAAYLDRAVTAAARGERLSRSAWRVLWGEESELQLELNWPQTCRDQLDAAELAAEGQRIQQLRRILDEAPSADPKAEALAQVLSARRSGKTLVFTSAVATASYLARRLEWRRVCTATAGGARIASGPINLEHALTLFAPRARGAAAPPSTLELETLIATDLLSEGFNLQDADAIVHYDLPWTPLRLEQRLGRLARLGSGHERVRVWWFRPCETIEAALTLAVRLSAKAGAQLGLGVPTSSVVGRARILGGLFDWRERFAAAAGGTSPGPRFAVVRAPLVALCALRWTLGTQVLPELLVLAGEPPVAVSDERAASHLCRLLAGAAASPAPPPRALTDALHAAVRVRLADARHGPRDQETRRMARRLLRLAASAARLRHRVSVELLDCALDRLTRGTAIGAQRELETLLAQRPQPETLQRWLRQTPALPEAAPMVTLEAALVGDGTLTADGRRGIFAGE